MTDNTGTVDKVIHMTVPGNTVDSDKIVQYTVKNSKTNITIHYTHNLQPLYPLSGSHILS